MIKVTIEYYAHDPRLDEDWASTALDAAAAAVGRPIAVHCCMAVDVDDAASDDGCATCMSKVLPITKIMPTYTVTLGKTVAYTATLIASATDEAAAIAAARKSVTEDEWDIADWESDSTCLSVEQVEQCRHCGDAFGEGEFAKSRVDPWLCHWCYTNEGPEE